MYPTKNFNELIMEVEMYNTDLFLYNLDLF